MKNYLLTRKFIGLLFAIVMPMNYGISQIAQIDVPYVDPSLITIDGLADDWASVNAVPIAVDLLGSNPTEEDFKATFKARWSDDNLYLMFEIKDQTIVGASDAKKVWLGDHIEVGTTFHKDEIYDVRAKGDPNASPDDAKFFISWSVGFDSLFYQLKNTAVNFEYKKIAVTGGYNVEIKMPFVVLYPDAVIANGDSLRVEITAGDSEDGVNRAHQLRWSGSGDINLDFSGHGKFTFIGKSGVGVTPSKSNHLNFYPNPATDRIIIQNANDVNFIEMYDLTGKRVKSQIHNFSQNAQMEVSDLKAGLYIISVKRNDGSKEVGKFHKL